MEARLLRAAVLVAALTSMAASYRTQNFIVTAQSPQFAQQVALSAERFRRDLAHQWLGHELPPWRGPCPITVTAGAMGAGGATSFMFDQQGPHGWTMNIQGTPERIIDSVLPHEVTHTIFATHFGRPLPRWADEGACTTVEHESEKMKQEHLLKQFLTTGRGIAFNKMFAMKEYPSDILPLYSQGYSLARYLIAQGGKLKFVQYVKDGMDWNNWTAATKKHYGFESLSELQLTWVDWVRQGYPDVPSRDAMAENAIAMADAQEPISAVDTSDNDPPGSQPTGPNEGLQAVPGDVAKSLSQPVANIKRQPTTPGTELGWYQRQRDLRFQDRGTSATAGQRPSASRQIPASPVSTSLTRPQPIGRPRQIILEWDAEDGRQGRPAPPAQLSELPTGATLR